jgi:hypothetical protein
VRSRWKLQVRRDVKQKKGRTYETQWEKTAQENLQEDKLGGASWLLDNPHESRNAEGRREEIYFNIL